MSDLPENIGDEDGSGDSKQLYFPKELQDPPRCSFALLTNYSADELVDVLYHLREDPSQEQDLS